MNAIGLPGDQTTEVLREVLPDLYRIRLPLPFPPREVNAWLLGGSDGWTLIDCGIDDAPTRAIFTNVLSDSRLRAKPVTRLVATHFHPDHVGLAGWLRARTGAEFHMSRQEWEQAQFHSRLAPSTAIPQIVAHHARAGAPRSFLEFLPRDGWIFSKSVGPLPERYVPVKDDDVLILAGSAWRVIVAEGHAPEMICLYSPERRVLIAADQILERISPHIGVHPFDPIGDPLGIFLKSLSRFEALPDDILVLPSHGDPFPGLHARIAALRAHHAAHLDQLVDFCRMPRTVMETLDVLFRPLPLDQIGFGLSEALAHLRHLVNLQALDEACEGDRWRFVRR